MDSTIGFAKLSRHNMLLSSVAASALLMGLGMPIANAATATTANTVVDALGNLTAEAYVALIGGLNNTASGSTNNSVNVNATLSNITTANALTNSSTGGVSSSSQGTTANSIAANAIGNTQTSTASLAQIGDNNTTGANGLASLISTSNDGTATGPVTVNSSVTNSGFSTSASNLGGATAATAPTGSLTQTGNQIAATTNLNKASTTLSGELPTTYTGAGVAGAASLNPSGITTQLQKGGGTAKTRNTQSANTLDASGNIVASTNQVNTTAGQVAGSSAVATGNNVDLTVSNSNTAIPPAPLPAPEYTAATLTNSSNSIAATYTGNSATSDVGVSLGGATALSGSAIISNEQQNLADSTGTGTLAANASNNNIYTQVGSQSGRVYGQNATLITNNNTISATATGNTTQAASGSGAAAGNELSLASGVSLAGATTTQANSISGIGGTAAPGGASGTYTGNVVYPALPGGTVVPTTNTQADLGVASFQNNNTAPLSVKAGYNTIGSQIGGSTNSTLDVSGNAVTASVTGNNASNAIVAPGATSTSQTPSIYGVAAITNAQSSTASSVSATSTNNTITNTSGLGRAPKTSLTMNGDSVGSSAVTNNAQNSLSVAADQVAAAPNGGTATAAYLTAAVSGENLNNGSTSTGAVGSSSASAGLSVNNLQYNTTSDATALTTGNVIIAHDNGVTGITNDSVNVSGVAGTATQQAVAENNVASNGLSVNATGLTGSAGIVDAQMNGSNASATVSDAQVGADLLAGGTVTGTTAAVGTGITNGVPNATGGNVLRAIAYNNQGADALSVAATSNATAPVVGTATGASNTAANAGWNATTGVTSPTVNAAFGALAAQTSTGNSSATFTAGTTPLNLSDNAASTTNSTLSDAGNSIVAAAYGNQEGNSASLSAGTLTGQTGVPVEVAMTAQNQSGVTTAGITGVAAGRNTVVAGATPTYQYLPGALFVSNVGVGNTNPSNVVLDHSTVATSGNTALSQAQGNAANTGITLSGNNVTATGGTGQLTSYTAQGNDGGTSDAAFVAQTSQNTDNSVSATQATTGALTDVNGSVTHATLLAGTNTFSANATSNQSTTSASIGSSTAPVTLVDTTAGANNAQQASGATTATLGSAGSPATPGTPAVNIGQVPYTVASGNNHATVTGTTLAVTGNPLVFNVSGLSGAALTDFLSLVPGGAYDATAGTYTLDAGNYTLSQSGVFPNGGLYLTTGSGISNQSTSSLTIPASGGTPATPTYPAVEVITSGNLTGVTATVQGNANSASAIANSANTSLSVAANTLSNGMATTGTAATATSGGEGDGVTVNGAYTLANAQMQGGSSVPTVGPIPAPVSSTAYGLFTVADMVTNPSVTGSALTVSGNSVSSTAKGNLATDSLSLSAANSTTGTGVTPASGALTSDQGQWDTVTANAGSMTGAAVTNYGMTVQAPAAITNSSVTLTDNTNTATAVGNSVTNGLTATGGNLASGITGTLASGTGFIGDGAEAKASGDLALANSQTTQATTSATATSLIGNSEVAANTAGLVNGSANFSSNATAANATGNNAGNTLSVTGNNVGAASALSNVQYAFDGTSAGAVQNVAFNLNGGLVANNAAASDAGITLNANSVTANAINNVATNTLSEAVTNASGSGVGTVLFSNGGTATASGQLALQNVQKSNGKATANGYSNVTAVDSTTTLPISTSKLTVQGNALTAQAIDNQGTNTLSLAATNAGSLPFTSPAALLNDQIATNGATATAAATDTAPAATSNSTTTLANNVTVAEGVGNQGTNSLSVTAANAATEGSIAVANSSSATADYALGSTQNNSGPISSSASNSVTNSDGAGVTTVGLDAGAASITGNQTQSLAFGNDVSNALNMSGANLTATGALSNGQSNSGVVTATGSMAGTVSLTGTGGASPSPAAQDAALNVTGNSLEAQGVGNAATNALNVPATANYGTANQASGASINGVAEASYALANNQGNTGAVSATITGTAGSPSASFGVALNGGTNGALGSDGALNTVATVANNNVTAHAFGNSASNTASVAALNSGNPTVAVSNYQNNAANVTATVTYAHMGVATAGGIGAVGALGSTLNVGGNSIAAQAVGNSGVTSVITK